MTLALPRLPDLAMLDNVEQRTGLPSRLYSLLVALACSAVWIVATEIIRVVGFNDFYGVPLALAAVAIAAWAAGLASGLITAGLSVAMLYAILPSMRVLDVREESIWHLVVFSLVAVAMSGFEAAVRRQHENYARQKKMRDEFLAIVSHELRTPVTIIHGGANLLSRLHDSMSAEDRAELLSSMQEESGRLSRMIDDLLLLERLETGNVDVNEPLLLNTDLVRNVEAFKRLYPAREVHLRLPEERLIVQGRRTYIDAVVRNVLSNAHRFSPINQPIELTARRERTETLVVVRDHGPGISPEIQQEIFEPYYRSQPVSDGTRGIGLGLSLCRRAMHSMGGSVGATNSPDGGLAVQLRFQGETAEVPPSVHSP